jgi:hypothetical protein
MTDTEHESRMIVALAGRIAENFPCQPKGALIRVCRHEAGHAVAAFVRGVPTEYVIIESNGTINGTINGLVAFKHADGSSPTPDEIQIHRHSTDQRGVLARLYYLCGERLPEVRREFRRLQTAARALVQQHEWLVCDVEDELLRRRRLTGTELTDFLQSTIAFRNRRRWAAQERPVASGCCP